MTLYHDGGWTLKTSRFNVTFLSTVFDHVGTFSFSFFFTVLETNIVHLNPFKLNTERPLSSKLLLLNYNSSLLLLYLCSGWTAVMETTCNDFILFFISSYNLEIWIRVNRIKQNTVTMVIFCSWWMNVSTFIISFIYQFVV